MKRNFALFQVGLKVLLWKGSQLLLLKARHLALPGGRIDSGEVWDSWGEVIAREVKEELGMKVKFRLGKPAFLFRRYSKEHKRPILVVVYEGKYLSGGIKLSSEHSSYQWFNPKTHSLRRKDFRSAEEYKVFSDYFLSQRGQK